MMDELTSKPPQINPNTDPTKQTAAPPNVQPSGGTDYLALARDAFRQSTTYVDSNYRAGWENSIRAFFSQHATTSKYTNPAYSKRSTIYRPKTRTIIRKNEAAAAAAFFSNADVVSIEAVDMSNPAEQASAEVMKALLQYRLKKSIPWFKIIQGAIQDAQVTAAVARCEWLFKKDKDGAIKEDRPVIDLIPIENVRFDPGASWLDPVNTSPYWIELMPMYVCDVKERMEQVDPKTGMAKWRKLPDTVISQATQPLGDSTRLARSNGRNDPNEHDSKTISEYETVWVQRHIHRIEGEDMEWYTMGTEAMLTKPRPLSESVLHGKRPYVIGTALLETHRPLPSTLPQLIQGLQEESNEIANQRLDNVKFVLNKRWFVQRGKNADISSLVRNTPGGVTMVDGDPNQSIKEVNWPDVTASSYAEQDRLNSDLDELGGNFSAASVSQSAQTYQTQGKLELLQTPSSMLTEYLLRTFTETFVEPVLRMLIQLEQFYETDETILAVAAKQSKIQQRFGVDQVTDDMMRKELTLTVNVGMGATNPQQKQQKFANALNMVMAAAGFNQKSPGVINITEVAKESWAHSGYQDGTRFMAGQDPAQAQMQAQMQQMQQMIVQLQKALKDKLSVEETKRMKTTQDNQTKVLVEAIRQDNQNKRTLQGHVAEGLHRTFEHHNQYTKTGLGDAKH